MPRYTTEFLLDYQVIIKLQDCFLDLSTPPPVFNSNTYLTVYKKIVSYLEKDAPFLPPIASDFVKYFAFGNAP